MGRCLRDVTRNSTGKLFFLPSGLTIKTKESAKCPRATTGFSTSYGRGKYWLIYQNPEVKRKADHCWTEMLYSNPRKCQYLCRQHLQACSFDCHIELPSEQRSRNRRRLNFMPIAFGRRSSFFCSVGMKFSLLRFRDLCSEGSSV